MRRWGWAAVVMVMLAGCAPSGAEPEAEAALAPVIDRDFPDPDVLEVDGTFWAYATNDATSNVQVATSTDLRSWQSQPDAMPVLPEWVIPGDTWAPEVAQFGPSEFVLYFTAHDAVADLQCIGVATATSPGGPFTAIGDGMLVCPVDEGGAIDASTFVDRDGTAHLLWKNDGNCCRLDTWISVAPLAEDGLALAGEPTRLIHRDEGWEGQLVEAPTMVVRPGGYVLFYSANNYASLDYAIGYATATRLEGPWTKHDGPWLSTDDTGFQIIGPGGQDVVGDTILVHGWDDMVTYRAMYALPLEWDGDAPIPPAF